jgi:hypothetical protein
VTAQVELKIFKALIARLDAYVAASPIPVAIPNVDFDPTKLTSAQPGYLRPSMLPAASQDFAVSNNGSIICLGLMQVDVFWRNNQGLVKPLGRAADLMDFFKKGTRLVFQGVRVHVLKPPFYAAPMQEPGWIQIPVSIPYTAYASNA